MENLFARTPLFAAHHHAKARLVPFAGWEMPVQYAGVLDEVRAVRESCGVFDVSHMGQLFVSGAGATDSLNRVVSADWSKVALHRAAYGLLLNERGGIIDDVMGYRLGEDEWLVVVNASRTQVDIAHLQQHLGAVSLFFGSERAMLAVQGPQAQTVLQAFTETDLGAMNWRDVRGVQVLGKPCLLTRGGYTGCDGFEWMGAGEDVAPLWEALLQNGAVPCGLGARDVLRLEAALPLYGHELREEWTPYESGVGFAVSKTKSDFVGSEVLERVTPTRRIRGVVMEGRGIAREGYAMVQDGEVVGEITSGTHSAAVGGGIALAMLPIEIGDAPMQVQIRSALHPCRIVPTPFVSHGRK